MATDSNCCTDAVVSKDRAGSDEHSPFIEAYLTGIISGLLVKQALETGIAEA
jgi:hypothetical protein